MTALWYTGDVFEVMAGLPDGSVDMVLTSPPFLALRSYLPADHPDKGKEIGSEPNPAAFIDTLMDLTVEWRRLLAPHGSLCVELGDTYAGSATTAAVDRPQDDETGGMKYSRIPSDGRPPIRNMNSRVQGGGPGWPLAKSLCLIPELYRIALVYGFNPLNPEHRMEPWRARNVVRWCRPNPPVGALGDKFRPATSDMVVACVSGRRYFDLDSVREPGSPNTHARTAKGVESRPNTGKSADDDRRGGNFSTLDVLHSTAGAPPLDWWEIPTHPYKGSHYATWPPELCVRPIKAMCPAFVCESCGIALGSSHDAPRTVLPGVRRGDHQPVAHEGNAVLLEGMCQSAHGAQPQEHAGLDTRSEGLHPDPGAGTPDGEPRGLRHGTSVSDGREVGADARVARGGASHQRGQGRQPSRELAGDGQEPARRSAEIVAQDGVPALWRAGSSSEPCPACGGSLRRGRVLDPFAGSGTTLAVATGHGRDAIGIDLDPRNLDLARERVGMFLEVAA